MNKLKIVFCSVFAGLMLWLCVATTCVACQLLPKNTKNNYIEAREIYLQSETKKIDPNNTGNKYRYFYSNIKVEYDPENKWVTATQNDYDNFTGIKIDAYYSTNTITADNRYSAHDYYGLYQIGNYVMYKQYDDSISDYRYYKINYKITNYNTVKFYLNGNTFSFIDANNNTYTIKIPEENIYQQSDEQNRITAIKTDEYDLTIKY